MTADVPVNVPVNVPINVPINDRRFIEFAGARKTGGYRIREQS